MRLGVSMLACLLAPFVLSADATRADVRLPGKIVFWSDRGANSIDLWVVEANGKGLRRLTRRAGSDFEPSWSPRGDRVVFHGYGPPAGKGEIYVVSANGRGLRRLTKNTVDDVDPTWSPDGQKILFVRYARRSTDLFVMRSVGSRPRRITRTPTCEREPDWSPDGKRIAVSSGCGALGEIVVLNADGSGARVVTHTGGRGPVWSPNGRRIAFTSDRSIRIVNADGSGETRLPVEAAGQGISWSPDGTMLAFSKSTASSCRISDVDLIYAVSLSGGSPMPVTKDPCTDGDQSPDWHR